MAELYRIKPFEEDEARCIFVGTTEQCEKAKTMLEEYHQYDTNQPRIEIREPVMVGDEQEYIEKCLDETIDFEYGY